MQDHPIVLKPTRVQAEYRGLVLASQSSARRTILGEAGLQATYLSSGVDEEAIKTRSLRDGLDADQTVLALAHAKAAAIRMPGMLVLGADQMLVCDGARYDKPADMIEARAHLLALRGRTHVLHTAIVLCCNDQIIWQHVAHPTLGMRQFSDSFLDLYLAAEGQAILACVGAYRLEAMGAQLFDTIAGDHTAILGLPLLPLLGALRDIGYLPA